MALMLLLRKVAFSRSNASFRPWLVRGRVSSSREATPFGCARGYSTDNKVHLSPLFPENDPGGLNDCRIQLIDDETWRVSSGLADAWRVNEYDNSLKTRPLVREHEDDSDDYGVVNSVAFNKEDPDFDEIEDMRMHRSLFYKLEKNSKEYDEYKYDFHRRKSPKNEKDRKDSKENKKKDNSSVAPAPKKVEQREVKRNKESFKTEASLRRMKDESYKTEASPRHIKDDHLISQLREAGSSTVEKRQRTLTFNQQTAPYHEPFFLDIYLSKGSVRASIIHRATSQVVVVAHSISKDMKFDLSSTKNRNACAAVGEALAQRALADDIHNAVYTPRKGEKLEGKLQIVLKSVIDGGVNVKVKLKQKKLRKATSFPSRFRH